MKKVRECVEVIQELDNTEKIQIGFSSIIQRTDKVFSNEIRETNIKLNNYCLGKGFIFVDNDNINESCLNNSKLILNKETQRLAKNILSSLDIWYATTRSIGSDIINRQLSTSTFISKELKELRIENLLKLIFSYLNINSIRSKFNDLQQVICDSVDILSIAETKIDSSFPTAKFHLPNYHSPCRLDISDKSRGILLYIKWNIPTHRVDCGNLCKSIQAVLFEINLRKEKWLVVSIYQPPSQNWNFSKLLSKYHRSFYKTLWELYNHWWLYSWTN